MINTELSEDDRRDSMNLCELTLVAWGQKGNAIKPPAPIREWTEEMIRPRVDELEANNRKWREFWDKGLHEQFPEYKPGEVLRSTHLDANAYIALKQKLEFLSGPGPEYDKDAEGIGVAQAAAVLQHTRQIPSVAQTPDGENCAGTEQRAAVDAFIEEVLQETGKRITRTDIWRAAGYKDRTEFERFQRDDPRTTDSAKAAFYRTLKMKPKAFIELRDKNNTRK